MAAPTPSIAAPAELPASARMVGAQSTTWASWASLGEIYRGFGHCSDRRIWGSLVLDLIVVR